MPTGWKTLRSWPPQAGHSVSGVVRERLHDLEVLTAGLAGVFVGGHRANVLRWHSRATTAKCTLGRLDPAPPADAPGRDDDHRPHHRRRCDGGEPHRERGRRARLRPPAPGRRLRGVAAGRGPGGGRPRRPVRGRRSPPHRRRRGRRPGPRGDPAPDPRRGGRRSRHRGHGGGRHRRIGAPRPAVRAPGRGPRRGDADQPERRRPGHRRPPAAPVRWFDRRRAVARHRPARWHHPIRGGRPVARGREAGRRQHRRPRKAPRGRPAPRRLRGHVQRSAPLRHGRRLRRRAHRPGDGTAPRGPEPHPAHPHPRWPPHHAGDPHRARRIRRERHGDRTGRGADGRRPVRVRRRPDAPAGRSRRRHRALPPRPRVQQDDRQPPVARRGARAEPARVPGGDGAARRRPGVDARHRRHHRRRPRGLHAHAPGGPGALLRTGRHARQDPGHGRPELARPEPRAQRHRHRRRRRHASWRPCNTRGRSALAEGEPEVDVAMAVPVVSDGRLYGVIAVYGHGDGGEFREEDVHTLQTFARQTEVAIGNVFLHDETRRQARTDGTTGTLEPPRVRAAGAGDGEGSDAVRGAVRRHPRATSTTSSSSTTATTTRPATPR